MSTTRLAFGAILGTIQNAAATVTTALDATNNGVGMLSAFVTEASIDQKLRNVANREDFLENLIQERAEARSIGALKVEAFCAKSAQHAKHYADAYDTFTKLLRPATQG
jgi:hypothetical protein